MAFFIKKNTSLLRCFVVGLLSLCTLAINAQDSREVKLVVMGEAETKEAAIAQALRSAIEMSFGAFVSANTTILNDELVKDEIATISSGNIKSFEEIASVQIAGRYNVTIEAVVSLGNLISYAKGKGSSCEFAGQTFAYNIKLKELNRQNELKVIARLKEQASLIAKDVFDFSINAGDPKLSGKNFVIPLKISVSTNEASNNYYKLITQTLSSLCLSRSEIMDYEKSNIDIYQLDITAKTNDGWFRYNYNYLLRNNVTKDIKEILLLPFQNVYYTAHYADQKQKCLIDIKKFQYRKQYQTIPHYPTIEGGAIHYNIFPLLKIWKQKQKLPVEQTNKRRKKNGKSQDSLEGSNDNNSESWVYIENREAALDIWAKSPKGKTDNQGNALEWWVNDPASPFTSASIWGTSVSKSRIDSYIHELFCQKVSPLFEIEIEHTVSEQELSNLTGFSIRE